MRLAPTATIALICVAMLGMQLSGLHLHVNPQGDSGELHGLHVHDADPDGQDHSADVDVRLLELGTTWSKALTFLVPVAVTLASVVWVFQTIRYPLQQRYSLQRQTHWRPPLRAPPLSP